MKGFFLTLTAILIFGLISEAHSQISGKTTDAAALELAKATFAAHGGEKFKNMKTLVVRGTSDFTISPTITIPAGFAFVFSGERYRVDISNPFQPLKQIFDGEQTYSSINGFSLPPLNRLGLPLLQKLGMEGFIVSALPEKFKNKKGFRITSPEGYYTDFLIDEKTGQVKSYESSYQTNGREVTTSVEIDKTRNVDGIIIPEHYAQRFDLGNLTAYADFKAKEILVNSQISDDVFAIPK
ncbi:MAG: hypothetical protein ACR2GD_07600 [Pyrinomonadaceae bacterium]